MKTLTRIGLSGLWMAVGIQVWCIVFIHTIDKRCLSPVVEILVEGLHDFLGNLYACIPYVVLFSFGLYLCLVLHKRAKKWEYVNLFIAIGCILTAYILTLIREDRINGGLFWSIHAVMWFGIGMTALILILRDLVRQPIYLNRWITAVIPTFYVMTCHVGIYGCFRMWCTILLFTLCVLHTQTLIKQINQEC